MSGIKKYSKNIDVIEAIQWDGTHEGAAEILPLLGEGAKVVDDPDGIYIAGPHHLQVRPGNYLTRNARNPWELFMPTDGPHFEAHHTAT